jgi:plastocyanin
MVYVEGEVRVVNATTLTRKDGSQIRVQHVVLMGPDGLLASGYVPLAWKVSVGDQVRWQVVSAAMRSRVYRFWAS